MKVQNKIINAHRRNIREERFLRMVEIEKIEQKPTEPIALRDYCKVKRPLDLFEMIQRETEIVDAINHPFVPMFAPKDMKIPSNIKESVGLWNFFKANVYSILP